MAATTNTIFKALAAAQADFQSAIKDTSNTFFKSKYADLSAVWEACKDGLKANGLFVSQQAGFIESAGCWAIVTKIYNEAGESIEGTTPIIASKPNDPQAFGSAMTYARRYGLAATLGIVTDDDDAEGAMNRNKVTTADKVEAPVKATADQVNEIRNLVAHDSVSPDQESKALASIPGITYQKADAVIARLNQIIKERGSQAA